MRIVRKDGRGVVSAWIEGDEIFIRESLDRGKDVQTICLSRKELLKILELEPEESK